MKKETWLPGEIYKNRKLVFSLAKNDFKTKYAGSYFGTVWAFVQPIVTICVYWFVFGLALRNGSDKGVPFVLWLIAGLVPWFFIQEGLTGGTNALLEYNYLVKKVVFNIRILPVVKVFSAVFVHCFFVVIVLVIYTCMGYPPSLYALQLVYYSFCIFMLILAVTYMTSAAVVFFRDLSQIINIMLQVGVWVTPIMWDFNDLGLGGLLVNILKLNPVFYIVQGYRDSLINKVAIWEHPVLTLYFWGFTLIVFVLGTRLFKKLQVNYQILMVEWLYSLFSSSIPLEAQYDFYYGFFNEGWEFFYKMCISCFLQLKGTFYEAEDVYVALKFEKNKDGQLQGNVDTWKEVIKRAYQIEI